MAGGKISGNVIPYANGIAVDLEGVIADSLVAECFGACGDCFHIVLRFCVASCN